MVGSGAARNAAAALGVAAGPGDVIISIGTSGVVSTIADSPIADPTGEVIDFADATGRFLRLAGTPNAARVLDATAHMLGVRHEQFARALSAPPGSSGLVVLPYVEKGSTLAQLRATGVVYGMTEANSTAAHIARATVEGVLCDLAVFLDALMLHDGGPRRLLLAGGAARSEAVRQIAPTVFCQPVIIPGTEELGAYGAARQAAWALRSAPDPPPWRRAGAQELRSAAVPSIRSRFADARRRFQQALGS